MIYMSPNQATPAQNVKIRRVRGLAALGVAAAVLVFAPFDWIYVKVSVSR